MCTIQPVALFLFAHQDDEFGVFQKILDEQRLGRRVYCAYLTSGAFPGYSPEHRNLESLAVLAKLGVRAEDVTFAGEALCIPDGALPEQLRKANRWITNWLISTPQVAAIYLPAWEGGHHDHDALHALGVMAAKKYDKLSIVKQFSLYNGYQCGGPLFRVLLPLPMNGPLEVIKVSWVNRLRFLRYCLSYPSQMVTWFGLFPFVMLHYLFYGTQMLQGVAIERIYIRPHMGPLYYERRKFYSWKEMMMRLQECEVDV
ncbi:MAG: PIG-L family deacetylase [Burkholderiaceae bacterium]